MEEKKTAVVTGASRGIGKAVALALAGAGYNLCLNAFSDREELGRVAGQAHRASTEVMYRTGDISDEEFVRSFFRQVDEKFGGTDILVNNAGIYIRKSVLELDLQDWKKTIDVNLTGAFLCSKASIPHMIERRWGRIINISSQLAVKGSRHGAHYAASKAGLLGLTKSMAIELGEYGINVNAILPGTIRTRILEHYSEKELQDMASAVPLKRIGTPEDVAGAVLFLASAQASYISGASINVSGGLLIC
ncbi:MAG: SDR family oxidoreductase [Thermoplasmata archaeon]|jgi:3-oxoacyl-[acyl-carrier protein] reductase|nr:SDR family oxidoreductase [Candidatus Sysuiplasma jiujiangense]MBX8639360.1 SDR family oxidoreductase [Candidatus Sysuiplasma jiujiangense]MBX8642415.1 SDR family oxidoreductase [Candidatus Sysuiplasma jiujiangense]